MPKEEKFLIDLENIRNDLAIEDMYISDADVVLYRKYFNQEINMVELIDTIKEQLIEGSK